MLKLNQGCFSLPYESLTWSFTLPHIVFCNPKQQWHSLFKVSLQSRMKHINWTKLTTFIVLLFSLHALSDHLFLYCTLVINLLQQKYKEIHSLVSRGSTLFVSLDTEADYVTEMKFDREQGQDPSWQSWLFLETASATLKQTLCGGGVVLLTGSSFNPFRRDYSLSFASKRPIRIKQMWK